MHVPDGIIPLWLQVTLLAVTGVMMYISYRRVKERFDDRLVPFMGVLAAVIFAAQLVNFPIPPFSSGHLVGSTLLAVMVSPWVAVLIMAMVLFIQALFGDGGILTYGVNAFNMAVFSVFVGYGIALVIYRFAKRYTSKQRSAILSTAIASFSVTVFAAFLLGLELFSVPGFGIEALGAITFVHVIIGVGEAILTSVILGYFVRANPSLVLLLRSGESEVALGDEDTVPTDEAEDEPKEPVWSPRYVIPVLVTSVVLVVFLVLAGLASENPDGFEWALFIFAGVPEPELAFEGLFSFLEAGPFADVLTGLIGIAIALAIGYLVFSYLGRKSTGNRTSDKFVLPFNGGKNTGSPFSGTAMLISALAVAVIVSLQTNLAPVLGIMALVLLVGGYVHTRWRRVLSLAAKFEVLILFWVLLEPFLYGSTVLFTFQMPWGPVYVYTEGVYLGLLLGARMLTILLVFLGTLSHMTLNDFIGSLRTLRVPSSILGSMLIMFRYVPLFLEERGRMQDAQKLRGYDRGRRLDRIRSLGSLVGTTMDRSFDRSTRVYDAMSLRGFGRGMMIQGSGLRRTDVLLPLLILALVAILPYIASLLSEVLLL